MNDEVKAHARAIVEILRKHGNPYQRVEIDCEGARIVSTDYFEPLVNKATEPTRPAALSENSSKYLFPGCSFPGPLASEAEYRRHYDEYVRRCIY
ncbi:hypothetical protein [Lacticaseibacillus parakribbianus]|uniref:hypothetical protein n=1 Tax=Lacticaseibacillus parakribbianus TaxID=2970927 RepID=UPI0021CB3319|nr:hypothetical protein [Lacticaseibacillus parakribbianus]